MTSTTPLAEQIARATEALRQVIDPEIGLNIVDLGLVYGIHFPEAENRIRIEMTLTSQFCPMGEAITDSAAELIREAFPELEPEIILVFDPRWGHHLISEEGLQYLNS
ncbi:metal-sulfur cluster assembly factor [Cesiribacter andamanensis]|uniref:Putative FeS assembly SUF system protein SufT n=1 Tax=Cesiribacter andamanensis AMV16 TaxID=1279009 RepID=M7N139_9BACT|nr:metal-sulfur cluster assembly factor [Cesiribacter andamanensis]EMR02388.1 putative FeS assembly SUF system protein SufT [Cesiribacter andamanensis AMV16]